MRELSWAVVHGAPEHASCAALWLQVRKGSAEVRFVDTRGTVVASEPFLDMADARRAPTLHRVLRLPFIDWTTKLPVSQMVIVDTAMGTDADAAIETDGGDATA